MTSRVVQAAPGSEKSVDVVSAKSTTPPPSHALNPMAVLAGDIHFVELGTRHQGRAGEEGVRVIIIGRQLVGAISSSR